jgi:hypothetical protein
VIAPPRYPQKFKSRIALLGVTWLLSAVAAFGQVSAPLNITSEEEAKLYSTLSQGSLRNHDPVDFALSVGAKVPAAVELYKVPEAVPAPVQGYQYMVHSDRVYIVDPSTREVVRVIPNR